MSTHAPNPPTDLGAAVSELRRSMGRTSIARFAEIYLPHYCKVPFGPMHTELFAMLEAATAKRSARLAVAAPRGHAKSTIVSLIYILWCICYGLEDYIVLISNTADQASDALSHIKKELEDNELLIRDFPNCCEPGRPGPSKWTREEAITPSGVKITALGAGSKIRGRKHRHNRPGLIVLDDVENEAGVKSADLRLALAEWFTKAVAKAGSGPTNIIVVGTILHYDSLLAHLTDSKRSPGWQGRVYKAVEAWATRTDLWQTWENLYNRLEEDAAGASGPDAAEAYFQAHKDEMLEGTKVLWSHRESYRDLMETRIRDGRASFDCEKQNSPVDEATAYFRDRDFVYWDDDYADAEDLLRKLKGRGYTYGACDPSLGKPGRNRDDTAIVTIFTDHQTGIMYVLDADINRRKPDNIIETVITYQKLRAFARFGFESTQFQEFLAGELFRRSAMSGARVPVISLHPSTDKLGRIQKLQPLVAAGRIRFSRRHVLLLEQLRQFPSAAHEDGPDALEMAVGLGDRPPVRLRSVVL